jgi:pilus assembly protein Flp/PilA
MARLKEFFQEESGVTSIEYGLIAVLIAVGIVVSCGLLGVKVSNLFITASSAYP